jgi:hypothetical protein
MNPPAPVTNTRKPSDLLTCASFRGNSSRSLESIAPSSIPGGGAHAEEPVLWRERQSAGDDRRRCCA